MSYPEALKQGKVAYKTTVFSLDKGHEYKLDYVADGKYKDSVGYCYGRLELKHNEFAELASEIAPGYNPENVAMITMFGGGKDICNNEYYQSEDIKNYLVYYTDEDDNVFLDYVFNKDRETYPISNIYSTVKLYFLMKRSRVENAPSLTDVVNKGFSNEDFKFIRKENDTLYLKIHNRLKKSGY